MTEFGHHDFELDAPPSGPAAPVPAAEPVVIIEYRSRGVSGVLVPPALILAAAAVLIAYRPEVSSWIEGLLPPPAPRPARRTPDPPAAPTSPLVLEVRALPAPDAQGPADPGGSVPGRPAVDAADVATIEAGARDTTPVGDLPAVAPPTAPDLEAERELARLQIEQEAERIQALRAERARMRARQAEVDRALEVQVEQARRDQAEGARERAQDGREAFRAELLATLRRFGDRAGPHILRVAESYHKEPGLSVEQAIARDLKGRAHRLTRAQRVALMRSHGLPEPLILGDLILQERRRRAEQAAARGHRPPRRSSAVDFQSVVLAARQLLAVPPPEILPVTARAAVLPGRIGLLGEQ